MSNQLPEPTIGRFVDQVEAEKSLVWNGYRITYLGGVNLADWIKKLPRETKMSDRS